MAGTHRELEQLLLELDLLIHPLLQLHKQNIDLG